MKVGAAPRERMNDLLAVDRNNATAVHALGVAATGSSSGSFGGVTLGGRYHVALVDSFFEPYVGVSMLRSQLDGYQEGGAGLLNIHYGNETQNLTTFEAGVRIGTEALLGDVAVVPWARLGGTQYAGDHVPQLTLRAVLMGALLGGVLIGLLASFSDGFLNARWTEAWVFAVLVLILLLRPTGLLGEQVGEKA